MQCVPFPPVSPFPVHTGTGELGLQGCALHGFLSVVIAFRTIRVQGEALLSVGEAHNKLFPVPARAGKGIKGKGLSTPIVARP